MHIIQRHSKKTLHFQSKPTQTWDSPLKVILGAGEIRGGAERKAGSFSASSSSVASFLGVEWPWDVTSGAGLSSLPAFKSSDLVDTNMLGIKREDDGWFSCRVCSSLVSDGVRRGRGDGVDSSFLSITGTGELG